MQKKLPSAPHFLLADNIATQDGGKLLVVGLYAGNEVVLRGTMPTGNVIALPGLYILATFMDGAGEFDVDFRMSAPTGKLLGKVKSILKVNLIQGKSQNIIMPVVPFHIIAFGRYQVELQMDKQTFKYEFAVRHEDPNMAFPSIHSKNKSPRKPTKAAARRVAASRK